MSLIEIFGYENIVPSINKQAAAASFQLFMEGFGYRYQDLDLMEEYLILANRLSDEADMMSGCLRHYAFDVKESKGRLNNYQDNELISQFLRMDPFEIDAGKIAQSKAYRKLSDKTQVHTFANNPYVRTRMSHTMEVEAIAVLLAIILGLNVSLVRAIARGHDIGHMPFGHEGEKVVEQISGKKFKHSTFGAIVAQRIEHQGKGLNCCFETLQGITRHSIGKEKPEDITGYPLEYIVVAIADQLAYTFSDINDAMRLKNISTDAIPEQILKLGTNQRDRLMVCILAIVKESMIHETVAFGNSYILKIFLEIREWMYANVYNKIDETELVADLIKVYGYFHDSQTFNPSDPLLALSLLTNKEVTHICQLLDKSKKWQSDIQEYIQEIELFEVMMKLPEDNPFDFNQVDLDPAHYS